VDRKEIIAALTSLAAELDSRGVSAEMYVVGGAAIALAFDERRPILRRRALQYAAGRATGMIDSWQR
jgi:hypothetical protein